MERKKAQDSGVIVASVSGGKDSTAMSLWLSECGYEHVRVFADTGWEHPATVEYVTETLPKYLGPIDTVRNDLTFAQLALKKGMFPSRIGRWCTSILKVKPILLYIERLETNNVINAVGIRASESRAREKLDKWELNKSMDLVVFRPIYHWSVDDVVDIHKRHNVPPNPLYLRGTTRVGCWPCIFSRKEEIRLMAKTDPERIDLIRELEKKVGDLAEQRYAKRGETLESLGYQRPTFFQRFGGMSPIDEVVSWSKTSFGGRQFNLFDDIVSSCERWGLCGT